MKHITMYALHIESWNLSALVHRSEASEAFGRWAIESINSAGCWHICRTVGKLQLLSFFFVQKLLPLISTRSHLYIYIYMYICPAACCHAQGLLWLDEGDTDKRFREMQFIKDIERDIRDICVQDGRWQNAIIPLSFDVGLQHALKPTKTPEDDDITAPIDISDEDMTVAPMETLDK